MNNYSIKCYVVEPSEKLKQTITNLVNNHKFIVDKGWENGYHLHLRGALEEAALENTIGKLKEGLKESVTEFDVNAFVTQYAKVAEIIETSSAFEPILKGVVTVKVENSIFEKPIEDELYREMNYIFDSYFCDNYFKENDLYGALQEAMKFHRKMEEYEIPGSTHAYNCHLSHYIAFSHRLNEEDRVTVDTQFKAKYESDVKEGLLDLDLTPSTLTENLLKFFHKIRPLVSSKELNFYMPFKRDFIDQNIKYATKRHQITFSKENMHLHLYNDVLIANRWMTNALYKKLLLLGLGNLDRFYMNYVVSRLTYPEHELYDY